MKFQMHPRTEGIRNRDKKRRLHSCTAKWFRITRSFGENLMETYDSILGLRGTPLSDKLENLYTHYLKRENTMQIAVVIKLFFTCSRTLLTRLMVYFSSDYYHLQNFHSSTDSHSLFCRSFYLSLIHI